MDWGNFWEKLKREWKTAAVAVIGAVVMGYESVAYMLDWSLMFGDKAPMVGFGLSVSMLLLRRWLDKQEQDTDVDSSVA